MEQKTKAQLKKELTPKQLIFCHQYIIDWNATRSAKEAGYSEDTAAAIGCENLIKPNIQQYIDLIKTDYETECGISKMRVVNEHIKLAFSNIAHLHNTWIELKQFEQLEDNEKACIESIDTKTLKKNIGSSEEPEIIDIEYVKIKLYSKQSSLESISKMMGYNEPDKIDLLSGERKRINDLFPTIEEMNETD
jgi:phage terminase small subunit